MPLRAFSHSGLGEMTHVTDRQVWRFSTAPKSHFQRQISSYEDI
jgi:hypothetical protein